MIIDIHTHSFPDGLAPRAIETLARQARASAYSDGTLSGLQLNMRESHVDYSVLQPVVTKPQQAMTINENAVRINETSRKTGVISFGGLHPDNEDYKEQMRFLVEHHVRGIKLHPSYQQVNFDDPRFVRIVDFACELGLYVLVHVGYDVGLPGNTCACVEHILPMLDRVDQSRLILAHMAGFGQWDMAEKYICGCDAYMDTAYSLLPIKPLAGSNRTDKEDPPMGQEQFLRFVKKHGAHKILFGTDSPWDTPERMIKYIREVGLPQAETDMILGENARQILGI